MILLLWDTNIYFLLGLCFSFPKFKVIYSQNIYKSQTLCTIVQLSESNLLKKRYIYMIMTAIML